MRMARIDLAPGVDDADHRLALPVIGVLADLAQPRAMAERTHVGNAKPAVAAEILGLLAGHCFLVFATATILGSFQSGAEAVDFCKRAQKRRPENGLGRGADAENQSAAGRAARHLDVR